MNDLLRRRAGGDSMTREAFLEQHRQLLPELSTALARLESIESALDQAEEHRYLKALSRLEQETDDGDGPQVDVVVETDAADGGRSLEATSGKAVSIAVPASIGRYRVLRVLADGGFGRVYLARDEQLARDVAIKVPHRRRVRSEEDIRSFLREARLAANLDHPSVVPVFDVGTTGDGSCYVVSKLIRGTDLAARLNASLPACEEAVAIVIASAEALHHAHQRGLVHRDVKPANILLDEAGRPHLTDFGLAIAGELDERGAGAGTPAYMSPEQARGESHRVDCRSDIFSLGIVLYELLTGVKPFQSASYERLLHQIAWEHPLPPSQLQPSLPAELERICLKALAKRAADRYPSAEELADDLRAFLARSCPQGSASGEPGPDGAAGGAAREARIVPKGLRPFDAGDAEFYLELVPGPRDREGLPELVRLWKQRIEEEDPHETCPVGLLFGPSGCGKSSLVRAGLLPRLASRVDAFYVEATFEDTEPRLLSRLRRRYPALPEEAGLVETLAAIRRGEGAAAGRKVLLVIDQLEQWLHGRPEQERRPLVQALRQCDGGRLQCLLMVRDDFWLGLSRLMNELEVELIVGRNASLVDLFDRSHARRVLARFGAAYGRLPERVAAIDAAGAEFLDEAIEGLAEEDKVVPARLALFAELVKARPWALATLRELGGAAGTGVAFLEETFGKRATNPQYRAHQRAARRVLQALLPLSTASLKGRVRSYPELMDLAGYGRNPRAFKELMRILDVETRLLTPSDPEGLLAEGIPVAAGNRYFQLSHDYLVPALRQWSTERQQATAAGRTELCLAERAMLWNARPERRQLPSLGEWLAISLLTHRSRWTEDQRRMMRIAGRRHVFGLATLAALALAFLVAGVEISATTRNVLMQFRARAAGLWLACGQEEAVWPLLRHSADPTLRTGVIHRLNPLLVRPEDLLSAVPGQHDPSARRAMVLVAGQLLGDPQDRSSRSSALRRDDPRIQELLAWYRDDPDPGMHAAVAWTLSRYEQDAQVDRIDSQLAEPGVQGGRQWTINPQGHTLMVIAGPAPFAMGSPAGERDRGEDESLRERWIRRSFCLASQETTVEQFQRFLDSAASRLDVLPPAADSPSSQPRVQVSWYAAAAYCNWLSESEGIPRDQWCYEPNAEGRYAAGMRLAPAWFDRRGYRLPTEAEWEYACRAQASTRWHFGGSPTYLASYAVIAGPDSRLQHGGGRMPNDFGLFDMHGNAAEWCQDAYQSEGTNGEASADETIEREVPAGAARVVRGGSYLDAAGTTRCAARSKYPPEHRDLRIGFRVARTQP